MSRRAGIGIVAAVLCVAIGGAVAYFAGPDDPNRLRDRVRSDIQAGRWDRAESGLRRLSRRRAPTSHDWVLWAQLAEVRGRLDEAVALLAHIPDENPLGPQARWKEGELERRRHHFRAAEAAFLRALKGDPRLKPARLGLIYLYGVQLRQAELRAQFRAEAEQHSPTYDDLIHWCRNWTVVDKPEETVAVLGPVVAADPGDRRSRLVLAEALRLLGRLDEEGSILSALPPADADARAARVRMLLDRGDDEAADALLAGGPQDHAGLARLRGRRALARRDPAEAVRQLEKARAADPDDRDTLFDLGHALRQVGRAKDAEPLLRRARAEDRLFGLVQNATGTAAPKDRRPYIALGAACEELGRLDEARGWYGLAVALDPTDIEAQQAMSRSAHRP